MSLGLPPLSVGLKSVAPYLQRAEELVDREPIIAYWCAYYAAQLGISLKTQDPNSRKLLLNLLDALERLKKEIGPNDAIDVEPASAAYVENFALKVFRMADDEDRAGNPSKSTAKKFLAAASFFEVLRVFPKTDVSDSTESKLKYAKWKAVDITRAFREGRHPTPGPAGSHLDPDLPPVIPSPDQFTSEQHPPTPPRPIPREPSPPTKSSSRSPRRTSPPTISPAELARANQLPILSSDDVALNPGHWSTAATPGLDLARSPGMDVVDSTPDGMSHWREHFTEPLPYTAAQPGSRTAWVSTEIEGAASDDDLAEDTALSRGMVRFALGTPGGASPPKRTSPQFHVGEVLSSSPPRVAELPPGFVPTSGPYAAAVEPVMYGSPRASGPSFLMASPPPSVPHTIPAFPGSHSSSPVVAPLSAIPSSMDAPPYPAPPPREVELTPKLVAKAQKHCRFAISALDYEDRLHAIRELKAALETLGVSV